jgi:hypothetical protein
MSTNTAARSDIRKNIKLEEIRVERVVAGQYRAYDRVTGDWIATVINCASRGKADWQAWGGAEIADPYVPGSTISRHRTYAMSLIAYLPQQILRWARGSY